MASTEDIEQILEERGSQYGNYVDKAAFIQEVKDLARIKSRWAALTAEQRESVDMIIHKLARILYGNPNHKDSWDDIAGYATLISKIIAGENP